MGRVTVQRVIQHSSRSRGLELFYIDKPFMQMWMELHQHRLISDLTKQTLSEVNAYFVSFKSTNVTVS